MREKERQEKNQDEKMKKNVHCFVYTTALVIGSVCTDRVIAIIKLLANTHLDWFTLKKP